MPCKALKPKIEKVESETTDVKFLYCDIDATMDFSQKMKIMSVPTVVAFHSGSEITRIVGGDEKAVRDLVDTLRSRATTNP
jgi:thioredoxin 1